MSEHAPATSTAEPAPEQGSTPAPGAKNLRETPAMKQHRRFKEQYPDCVLFFRMGDFYEMFFEDAVRAHDVLDITLTQRTEGIPMAGFPYHALEGYLRRMIDGGFRVAVCDQVEDAKDAGGLVERAVTRVLTPGTLIDEALLDDAVHNTTAAITWEGEDAILAVAEISTGSFTLTRVPAERLRDELARETPTELLYEEAEDGAIPSTLADTSAACGIALTARPGWTFRIPDAAELLTKHYGVSTLDGFGLGRDEPGLGPAGALLRYLQETQSPAGDMECLAHLSPPRWQDPGNRMILDATTMQSLEIVRTMRTGTAEGSLLWVLQDCRTAMGKRLLRDWLCAPLRDTSMIEDRLSRVACLIDNQKGASRIEQVLSGVQDIARIVSRITMGRATPRDLVALGRSAATVCDLADLLPEAPVFSSIQRHLDTTREAILPLAQSISASCIEDPPAHLRNGGLFENGIDDELDAARALQRDAGQWLARYQKEMSSETGIPSLKIGYTRVFGYYIEVTNTHSDKVPHSFHRTQTLKNAERYITPELKTWEEKILDSETRCIEREKELFETFCGRVREIASHLSAYAAVVAELDVHGCFARLGSRGGYVRPQIVEEPVLDITGGRHPVLGHMLGREFVPNDCRLGLPPDGEDDVATLALITGPNMAGKSTAIRQVALITLLAHTGCYVPAESAVIGIVDRIFTRIGASDELHAGRSTFMVEMIETATILHHATERSLVILDEIGRGTSTLDGLALAWAITESLTRRKALVLFATHYHELTALSETVPNLTNLHVTVREWGEEIIFLYRLQPGCTNRSYGIHVARLAGLPADTIQRAGEIMQNLEVRTAAREMPAGSAGMAGDRKSQLDLFAVAGGEPHPSIVLPEVSLDSLTPLEAFDILRSLLAGTEEERS